ncbi:hypothetical protein [Arsenicicoccus sp. oral taxon 190]|uniref:hypothetical protein n=1 Tax=Arsenicicoccus sp. oral taxon 190 TaxID=1658671 RepID=UPI00067A02D3|nr:hypothetical protein [Arsenicicoccus sp. oral taxon 190]AKT51403.1 hypothetical protein ADJ73_08850 [Arsenicicoccus sp. oral taxon 190]
MTRSHRPALRPGRRVLDRGDGEVQLGAHHGSAVVLSGLSTTDRVVLDGLDGSRSETELAREYTARGEDPGRLDVLLALLRRHAQLADPADQPPTDPHHVRHPWRRPGGLPVLVAGLGDLAGEVARVLARQHARVHTQHSLSPHALPLPPTLVPGSPRPPALAVLVADGAIDPILARQWAPWAMVLPVVAADGTVTVGPLWAGLDDPCPMCLDHYRTDRDPAWPRILAQLTTHGPDGGVRPAAADPATTALVCGLVARQALDAVGQRQLPSGLATDVTDGDPEPHRRLWSVHPRCDTHLPARQPLAG